MNFDPDVPMDTQLLQLERELFSLSPVETPRHLASRLDRQVQGPVSIGRQVASDATKLLPFPWRRIVVPAAAAVVVVTVLHRLDQPSSQSPGLAKTNSGYPSSALHSGRAPVTLTNGYVLRAEPIMVGPGNWQGMEQLYLIQPGTGVESGYNAPQRTSGLAPVVFH